MDIRASFIRIATLFIGVLSAACGGGGGGDPEVPPPTAQSVSATLGPDGGVVQVSDPANALNGLVLRVPPGALAAATTLTVERDAAVVSAALGNEQVVLKLGPAGTSFAQPVELNVPVAFTTSAAALGAYQTIQGGDRWAEVPDRTYDTSSRKVTLQVNHFSGVLLVPSRPRLPVPSTGRYSVAILAADGSPGNIFTSMEAQAIEDGILNGPLQPFYGCANGIAFERVPFPAVGKPTSDLVVERMDIPSIPQLSSFIWDPGFGQAFLTVRTTDAASGAPIKLYAGNGAIPPDAYDLRTIAAHELSHFMGIPSQPPPYDPDGLFFVTIDPGLRRTLTPADKLGLVERFPRCATPVVTIAANPPSALPGQSVALAWSTANHASACRASGAWNGSKPAAGTEQVNVGSVLGSHAFTLTCDGPMGSGAATANISVAAAVCAQVAGTWTVTDTATVSCSGSFGSGSDTVTETGTITIAQSGCDISFRSPANTQRTGTVTGNAIQFSGPMALSSPGVSFNENRISFSGTVSSDARRIDLTGTGRAAGSIQGSPGSCTATSTERLTR
jgi:hypothetical protein